jgi:hypothetical protein
MYDVSDSTYFENVMNKTICILYFEYNE